MFEFFDAIASILSTIVNFVLGIFEMIGNLLSIIYKGTMFLSAIFPNLPPYCMSFLMVIVALAILLQILNKGS